MHLNIIFLTQMLSSFLCMFQGKYFCLLISVQSSTFLQSNSMAILSYLTLVFFITIVAACPSSYTLPNLEAGTAFFSTSTKQSQLSTQTYQHSFTSSFSTAPAAALSLHSLGINNWISQWMVSVKSVNQTKLVLQWKYKSDEWTLIKVGFWVTTRNDIFVGSVGSKLDNLKQGNSVVSPDINEPIPNINRSVIRSFLTGYTAKSGNQIIFRTFEKSLNSGKVQIGIQVGGSLEIVFVLLNYIIFSPQTASFGSFGGSVGQSNLIQGKLTQIRKNIQYTPYRFHGITNFEKKSKTSIVVLTQIDSQFNLKINTLTQIQQIVVSFLIVGVNPNQMCSSCLDSKLALKQTCQSQCPQSGYLISYKDGGKGCHLCLDQLNMIVNSTKNGCVCKPGFIDKKGYCVDAKAISDISWQEKFSFESLNKQQKSIKTAPKQTMVIKAIKSSESANMIESVKVVPTKAVAIPIVELNSQRNRINQDVKQIKVVTNRISRTSNQQDEKFHQNKSIDNSFSTSSNSIGSKDSSSYQPTSAESKTISSAVSKKYSNSTSFPSIIAISMNGPKINQTYRLGSNLNSDYNLKDDKQNKSKSNQIEKSDKIVSTSTTVIPIVPNLNLNKKVEKQQEDGFAQSSSSKDFDSYYKPASAVVTIREKSQTSTVSKSSGLSAKVKIHESESVENINSIVRRTKQSSDRKDQYQQNSYIPSIVNQKQRDRKSPHPETQQSYVPSYPPSKKQHSTPSRGDNENRKQKSEQYENQSSSYIPHIPDRSNSHSPRQTSPSVKQQKQKEKNNEYSNNNCSYYPNTYWTGYKCNCKVGFKSVNGVCVTNRLAVVNPMRPSQFIYKFSDYSTVCGQFQVYDGMACVCQKGCYRSSLGKCAKDKPNKHKPGNDTVTDSVICPPNSRLLSGYDCQCYEGYQAQNNECQPIQYKNCPENSTLKSGKCVCNPGYEKANNRCVKKSKCGPNSYEDSQKKCKCHSGYSLYNDQCLLCPPTQIWIFGKCQQLCGCDQVYNDKKKKCQCADGYGLFRGICTKCSGDFFIRDGHCVTCPIYMTYNPQAKQCEIAAEYEKFGNKLKNRCKQNEIFNKLLGKCECRLGTTLINQKCSACPGQIDSKTGKCLSLTCKKNEIKSQNSCICQSGFGFNINQDCIKCQSIKNQYLVHGFCAFCPPTTQLIAGKCSCPPGKNLVNGECLSNCKPGFLVDERGFCYTCPVNHIIVDGSCTCAEGYQKVGESCRIKCKDGAVQINGACAICALNTKYNSQLKACICPEGLYMSQAGFCQKIKESSYSCKQSQYFSQAEGKCKSCPIGCKKCLSSQVCLQCKIKEMKPSGPLCLSVCGDGSQTSGQSCDDANKNSGDGCSALCQIEKGYTCQGSPSSCKPTIIRCGDKIVGGLQKCDDGNSLRDDGCFNCQVEPGWKCQNNICQKTSLYVPPSPSAGINLKLMSEPLINQNNVFVTLQTPEQYKFESSSAMRSFIKYSFPTPATQPSSAYCVQKRQQAKIFQCLIIYASGVPNKVFNVDFGYIYGATSGSISVTVNPLNSFLKKRSLS